MTFWIGAPPPPPIANTDDDSSNRRAQRCLPASSACAVCTVGRERKARCAVERAVKLLERLTFPDHLGGPDAFGIVGCKYWVQQHGPGSNVNFHYDKDEGLASDKSIMKTPPFVGVTHMDDFGAPTLVFNQTTTNNGNQDVRRAPRSTAAAAASRRALAPPPPMCLRRVKVQHVRDGGDVRSRMCRGCRCRRRPRRRGSCTQNATSMPCTAVTSRTARPPSSRPCPCFRGSCARRSSHRMPAGCTKRDRDNPTTRARSRCSCPRLPPALSLHTQLLSSPSPGARVMPRPMPPRWETVQPLEPNCHELKQDFPRAVAEMRHGNAGASPHTSPPRWTARPAR